MVRTLPVGLEEALKLTLEHVQPLGNERIELLEGLNRAVAVLMKALVDSPSIDASMKDGFAVISQEVAHATKDAPVRLELAGHMAAGSDREISVKPGATVRVLTGAKIPPGANAVVSEEFTQADDHKVTFFIHAEPGRNVLPRGSDVAVGQTIAEPGQVLTPGLIGFLAAAGHRRVEVVRRPRVSIIATGDEVVAPGAPLPDGKLYASNMTTLGGWCRRYGLATHLSIVKDEAEDIYNALASAAERSDAIVTSGGAWTGDRDLVAQILQRLGWKQIFHRIRIGPGKAVGFGMLDQRPIFILPGGPPSNLMGFLQIALPGLLKLSGHGQTGLPYIRVKLATDLRGRFADWTQFIYGQLDRQGDTTIFHSLRNKSRLRSMAEATAIVAIPEGQTLLPAGSVTDAQLLI